VSSILAGTCKNIELKVIRHGSSNLERNQSEAKAAAERATRGFDLPVDPDDYPIANYYEISLNDERGVQKVLRDLPKLQNNTKPFNLFGVQNRLQGCLIM
jgi:hypothetical protein